MHMKNPAQTGSGCIRFNDLNFHQATFAIQKIYAPSSSLLQGKHLPFTPSPLRLNIVRLFVILSLTQLYRTYMYEEIKGIKKDQKKRKI
jgi:hypothetical protein